MHASMSDRDTVESTVPTTGRGPPSRLALTVLWHPDAEMIGRRAELAPELDRLELSRLSPIFAADDGGPGRALGDVHLSRSPAWLTRSQGTGVVLSPAGGRVSLCADGRPLAGPQAFNAHELRHGVVVTLADRVTLLVHSLAGVLPQPPLGMVGRSEALARLRAAVGAAAAVDSPVLIVGETGSGKELAAEAVHGASRRRGGALVRVNMAAVPEATAASALFGHMAGAFTGATRAHGGYFGEAHRGTLFLDEIAAAPLELQAMLLRVLESGEVQPVGASTPTRLDVRVVAATDEPLERAVAAARFRAPLLHRLGALTLRVPPLRERREDLGLLVQHLLRTMATGDDQLRAAAAHLCRLMPAMARHSWPGNIRELGNFVRRLLADVATGAVNEAERLASLREPVTEASPSSSSRRPVELTQSDVLTALERCRWNLARAAQELGISRTSLYALIKAQGTVRPLQEISESELREVFATCEGRIELMAARLRTSARPLRAAVKRLGLRT